MKKRKLVYNVKKGSPVWGAEGGADMLPATRRQQIVELIQEKKSATVTEMAKLFDITAETIRRGYVTAPGGFRVGICGTALPGEGDNLGIKDISSLSIRIPRLCEGAALPVLPGLLEEGRPVSTLLLSPPGGGKTTLLRDLVRLLSRGDGLAEPVRVALVDERGELAAVCQGRPQLEVGPHTDIMDGCPKALAVPMLLRAMSPQVIALDELALPEDVEAVRAAAGCGVVLLATVHAASVAELSARPLLRGVLESGVFRRAVVIAGEDRRCRVEALP